MRYRELKYLPPQRAILVKEVRHFYEDYKYPGVYTCRIQVKQNMLQHIQSLHGGVCAFIAEELGSAASFDALVQKEDGKADGRIVGINVTMNHLSSAYESEWIYGVATCPHANETMFYWQIDLYAFKEPIEQDWDKAAQNRGRHISSGSLVTLIIQPDLQFDEKRKVRSNL